MDKNEIYKIMNYKIMLEVFSVAYYIFNFCTEFLHLIEDT